MRKFILTICGLFLLVGTIQIGAGVYFSGSTPAIASADLVAVFCGSIERNDAGIELVANGKAPHLMIVNMPRAVLVRFLKKKGISGTRAMPGGKSRSTFEDAYLIAQTIKENRFNSVIIITADYHMPRALLLLKIYLKAMGQDVNLQILPVIESQKLSIYVKAYGKEVIKLWGSVAEMAGNYFTGHLVLDDTDSKKIQQVIKKNLHL